MKIHVQLAIMVIDATVHVYVGTIPVRVTIEMDCVVVTQDGLGYYAICRVGLEHSEKVGVFRNAYPYWSERV